MKSAISEKLNKVLRSFCYCLYYGFARHLPVSYKTYTFGAKKIRYWICKPLFKKCGKNVNIEHGARFGSGRQLEIGDNSGLGVNCSISPPVIIGKDVMMGPDVVIYRNSHKFDRTDIPISEQGYSSSIPLEIFDDVWIGHGVFILPGCRRIGKGSIIGAGAVVTKDVPDYAIVGGNPAKIIRFRK